ncbi:monocarboxylate transporter 9 isoform X2 [Diabrotica virgifera virgifera]|uniref:Major facilitator superfamily (MFS) profile domain-containing protein n=1 Tax=Diabrotica virgifera virgifera TaxID=50390 RepID=A0ABM5KTI7_DIAVI|nr:monocarboxylate transporter 9 isoform X2 [Diabrotica virgifera virgifera]
MESPIKEAPLATLSGVAPSLESSPKKSEELILINPYEKPEVTFKTDSLCSSSSSSSSASESGDEAAKPKIPDGGWGWVVVFSSLLVSMIADGVSLSFGLLFSEFLIEFKASSSDTAWIGSLFLAVPLISGPIMSALVDKYGCRMMTCVGGTIAAAGFILSCRANTISIMYLTFGILAGLGLGLCYVTAVVSIAFWFDKKRTLAVGISASGTGVGTFIFSPLTNILIFEFGWRGTTLILGGLFLNMCVCGALMRDPDWITEQNKLNPKLSKSSKSSKTSLVSLSSTNFMKDLDIDELKDVLKSGKNVEYLLQGLETSIDSNAAAKSTLKNNHNSVLNLPTYIRQNEKVPVEVLEQLSSNRKLYNIILENFPSLLLSRSTSDKGLNILAGDASLVERVPVTVCMTLKKEEKEDHGLNGKELVQHKDKDVEAQEPLLAEKRSKKPGILKVPTVPKIKAQIAQAQRQNYFKNLKVHRQSLIHRGAIFNTHKYRFKASSCPNIYRVSTLTLKKDENEIFLGWAGDQPWMSITKTYAMCLVLTGVSCAGLMFFTNSFIMIELCAALFGVFVASTYSFTPGIIVELVPLDRFTTAYGLQLMCMGIGLLLGPPYAGHLYDVTNSWQQAFYQAAIWMVISGLMIGIIPYTKNRKIFGKGPVEKVVEDSEDRLWITTSIIAVFLILTVIVMYFTIMCLL